MSVQLPFKRYSKSNRHESSKISERLIDSNILQSNKTYGKNTTYKSLSVVSESSENFSSFVEDLFAEENSESATYDTSHSHSNNNQEDISPKFSLFNDDDFNFYSFSTDNSKVHSSSLSIHQSSSFASHYYRTRKNLKNRLLNQQYRSVEMSKLIFHEENLNRVADANESKSTSNFSNLNESTFSATQNLCAFVTNRSNHTKSNSVKSSDACINKLYQKSSIFQTAKQTEIMDSGTVVQNPLENSSINTNFFSIIDLVNRFSVNSDQAHTKNNPPYERKRLKSTPAKKMSVVKNVTSSKINFFVKKILISAKKSKNVILKSNKMNTQISDTKINSNVKKGIAKTPSKSVWKRSIRYIDNVKKSKAMDCVNNLDALENHTKILSSSLKKEHTRSVFSIGKSIDMMDNINNLDVPREGDDKIPLKTVKRNNDNMYNTEKSVTTKVKIQSSCGPTSNLDLVRNGTTEKIWSDDGDKQINESFILHKENIVRNPTFNNIPNINFGSNIFSAMPLINAPLPPVSLEGTWLFNANGEIVPSVSGRHSIQNDNLAVSLRNFEDLSIPGPFTLSNNLSSRNVSEYDIENEPSDNNHAYNKTTICRTENAITEAVISTSESKSQYLNCCCPRPFPNSSMVFDQFMASHFQKLRNNCILDFKEYSSKMLTAPIGNSCLLNYSVADFCSVPRITDTFGEYLRTIDLANPALTLRQNEGYDFPENFETENLLRVVKDFVQTTSSYIIPKNSSLPSYIPYENILQVAKQQMSLREFSILVLVFECAEPLFKLEEMFSRLGLVALLVIFAEFKWRQCRLIKDKCPTNTCLFCNS